MSTVRSTNKAVEIYRGDAPSFDVFLTKDDAEFTIAPTATISAIVQDDDGTNLIGPVGVTEIGTPTDDWTIGHIRVAFTDIDTNGAVRDSERAHLVVKVDDGGRLTWKGKTYDVRVRPDQ